MSFRLLLDTLPEHLRAILDIQAIAMCEQPEFDDLDPILKQSIDNQFIGTSNEYGLTRLEKIYGIIPKAIASVEERRFELETRAVEQRPTTLLFLKKKLDFLCGKNGYTIAIDTAGYKITLRLALASKNNETAVRELIARIKPANLIADIDLMYNKHNALISKTYGMLCTTTHNGLRSEIITV